MERNRKLLGRPLKAEGKRVRKVDVRFSEAEFAKIIALENLLRLRRTDIIRKRLLETDLKLVFDARAVLSSLDQMGLELSRSGNNINQLARYANILIKQRILSAVLFDRYLKELEKHLFQMKSLQRDIRKIIRMLGS